MCVSVSVDAMSVWGPMEIRRRCEGPWNYRWFGSHQDWVWGWTLSSVSKPKDSRCFQLLSCLSRHLTFISRTQLSNRVGRPKSPHCVPCTPFSPKPARRLSLNPLSSCHGWPSMALLQAYPVTTILGGLKVGSGSSQAGAQALCSL